MKKQLETAICETSMNFQIKYFYYIFDSTPPSYNYFLYFIMSHFLWEHFWSLKYLHTLHILKILNI